MQNAISFNPKDKSALLTYEQVAQTMKLGDSYGSMPKQVPVQPGELLVQIKDMIKQHSGLDIIQQPVVIREPYCQTNLNKVKSNVPLEYEDYLLKRFVTKFNLPLTAFEGEDKMSASFALTYAYTDNVKGIQIAFGENVHVCDNLCAYGQYHFSTYGNSRISFEEGMQLLTHWIMNLRTVHEKHIDSIKYLMSVEVPRRDFQRVIGSLFEKAVRANSGEQGIIAPLNQSQVAGMVAKGLDVLQDHDGYITAWDVMNWGTYTLKPHNSDMVDLIKSTAGFNDFIYREFDCPVSLGLN